ncbi:MAG TPA: TonB-dependent receptor plug domain-containing protein, partial [Puia sp.]|nr:TonB-dependent receptor plug domain-containing protein [Puia sp.]
MTKTRFLKAFLGCLYFILLIHQSRAQDKTVTGMVKDESNVPISGASILVKGTKFGTSTQADGSYKINAPATGTLIISFTGYETQIVPVKNKTEINITIRQSNSTLNSVVVIGYGTQKRKDVTGSVSSVKGTAIQDLPVTNATEALQGRAAGVEVIKNSGAPDATPTIIIRGLSSLHQPNPLYIVDGVRMPGDNINIQDIATIDILKDASAAAIYGSAAAGGVIVITTKRGADTKPSINFNVRYGVTKPKLVHLL